MRFPAFVFILSLALCSGAEPSDGVLRSAADVLRDLSDNATNPTPFRVTASVLFASDFCNKDKRTLVLDDGSGCFLSAYFDSQPAPRAGDVVDCSGQVERREFSRTVIVQRLKVVGHHPPAAPVCATVSELLDGKLDNRFIRLTGIAYDARESETDSHWSLLSLADANGVVNVGIHTDPSERNFIRGLVGSIITLDGFCTPKENGPRLHLGRTIKVNGISSIRILRRAAEHPDETPDISALADVSADKIPYLKRHRASGTVTAAWDGQAVIMTTNAMTVRIRFATDRLPAYGQRIEAIGFPETDLFNINLTQAIWHDRGGCADPAPVAAAELSSFQPRLPEWLRPNDYLHGKVVSTSGTVMAAPLQSSRHDILYLNNGDRMISVYVDPSWPLLRELPIGCTVAVTGLCILEAERWHPNLVYPKAHGFVIVTRTPADIRILARPSWWTTGRLLGVIGTLLAILIGIFIWNMALRRMATRKGRELFREQLGHVKADLRTEERTRLAVELHDTLAQNLTGVSMEIEAANDLRGNAPKPMLDHLGIAAKALKSCRDELRNCLWDLRSQALEEPDMTKAVLKTLQPVVNDSRLAVRFNVPRTRLSDNTAHALLRVIRELVVNAIRHGNASSVRVAGTIDCGKLHCSVTDNGCGFDPETAPGVLQGHFGLQGIRERIDEIGGTFEISSAPGKGAKAVITLTAPTEEEQ